MKMKKEDMECLNNLESGNKETTFDDLWHVITLCKQEAELVKIYKRAEELERNDKLKLRYFDYYVRKAELEICNKKVIDNAVTQFEKEVEDATARLKGGDASET